MTKNKAYWASLWHIYQPPVQTKEWLVKIANESYRKIIEIYKEFPNAKLTININASLTLLLQKHGLSDIIQGLKELAENGQLEFTSTTAFHVICPLLPEKEIIRQIKLNDKINRRAFGKSYKPTGVWLPEMAYSPNIIKVISKLGYKWIPLAGVASNGKWTNKGYYNVTNRKNKLNVVFRDDVVSLNIAFGRVNGNFVSQLKDKKGNYCFTAMDGETIGHHVHYMVEGLRATLKDIENSNEVETIKVSEIFDKFEYLGNVKAFPSSWSTNYEDIVKENYLPLWLEQYEEPFRTVHDLAWKHLYLLIEAFKHCKTKVKTTKQKKTLEEARNILDQAEHSCMYWWYTRESSHRDPIRFLAGLDLQTKVFIRLQNITNNTKMLKFIEDSDRLRSAIYNSMNNTALIQEEVVAMS